MTTRPIVPNANGEGSVGTAKKHWGSAYIDNTTFIVNTVADLKTESLNVGQLVKTLGYYSANDGGSAEYIVVDDIGDEQPDDGSIIQLQKNLYAKLMVSDYVNVKQFGAYIDGEYDDSENFNKAVTFIQKDKRQNSGGYYKGKTLFIPSGVMKIKSSITLDVACMSLLADSTIIDATECVGTAINVTSSYEYYVPYMNHTHVFCGFTLIGAKSDSTPSIGLEYSRNAGETSRITWRNILIDTFNIGIQTGENCYMTTYDTVCVKGCDKGYYTYDDGITNSGERETWFSSLFADNEIAIYNAHGAGIFMTNCSLDYNRQAAVLDKGGLLMTDCYVEFADYEKSHFVINNSNGRLTWRGGALSCIQYGGDSPSTRYDDDTFPFFFNNPINAGNNTTSFFRIENVSIGLIPAKFLCNQEPVYLKQNTLNGVYELPVKVKKVQGNIYTIDNYQVPTSYLPVSLKNMGGMVITYSNPSTFTVSRGASGNYRIFRVVRARYHKVFSFFLQGFIDSQLSNKPSINCEFGYLTMDRAGNLYKIFSQGTVNVSTYLNTTDQNNAGYTDKIWNKIIYVDDEENDIYAYVSLDFNNISDRKITLNRFDLYGY